MLYHMYLTNKNENGRADHVGVVKVKVNINQIPDLTRVNLSTAEIAYVEALLNPELVEIENIYDQYFSKFIDFMKEINFSILNFHKLFTETYSHRFFHISILEKSGFELEGLLRDHIIIDKKYFNSLIHSIIKNV